MPENCSAAHSSRHTTQPAVRECASDVEEVTTGVRLGLCAHVHVPRQQRRCAHAPARLLVNSRHAQSHAGPHSSSPPS
jgi:hypothetical protein